MPNIPLPPRTTVSKARERLEAALEWFLQSAGSSALVLVLAVFLWYFAVQVQYVAGAFIVVFAHRLAQKRLYPEVNVPEVPRARPVRDTMTKPKDPMEGLTPD